METLRLLSTTQQVDPALFGEEYSDYIDVTEERIDYGGLGNYLYVYSRNGKRPKYFYSPNPKKDRTFFKTYYLIDDWYLLKGSSR